MKVYLIVSEPYHDLSEVGQAFSTPELAMASMPGNWERDGFYIRNREGVVAQLAVDGDEYAHLIYEREVKGA